MAKGDTKKKKSSTKKKSTASKHSAKSTKKKHATKKTSMSKSMDARMKRIEDALEKVVAKIEPNQGAQKENKPSSETPKESTDTKPKQVVPETPKATQSTTSTPTTQKPITTTTKTPTTKPAASVPEESDIPKITPAPKPVEIPEPPFVIQPKAFQIKPSPKQPKSTVIDNLTPSPKSEPQPPQSKPATPTHPTQAIKKPQTQTPTTPTQGAPTSQTKPAVTNESSIARKMVSEAKGPSDNSEENKDECCPTFDELAWDKKEVNWKGKYFVKDKVKSFFHVPTNFNSTVKKITNKVKAAGAATKDRIILVDELSGSKSNIYISVTKPIEGLNDVKLSGNFLCKVFDASDKKTMKNWKKNMDSFMMLNKKTAKKYYFMYPLCPKCQKKQKKNFVVVMAEF